MISQDEHMSQDGDAKEFFSSDGVKIVSSNDAKSEVVHETEEASAGNNFFYIYS